MIRKEYKDHIPEAIKRNDILLWWGAVLSLNVTLKMTIDRTLVILEVVGAKAAPLHSLMPFLRFIGIQVKSNLVYCRR